MFSELWRCIADWSHNVLLCNVKMHCAVCKTDLGLWTRNSLWEWSRFIFSISFIFVSKLSMCHMCRVNMWFLLCLRSVCVRVFSTICCIMLQLHPECGQFLSQDVSQSDARYHHVQTWQVLCFLWNFKFNLLLISVITHIQFKWL